MSKIWRVSQACPVGHWPLPAGGVRGPLILDLPACWAASLQGCEGFLFYHLPYESRIPATSRDTRRGAGQAVPGFSGTGYKEAPIPKVFANPLANPPPPLGLCWGLRGLLSPQPSRAF